MPCSETGGFPARLARAAASYQQFDEDCATEMESVHALRGILNLAERLAVAVDAKAATADDLPEDLRKVLAQFHVDEAQIATGLETIRTNWKEWGALLKVVAPTSTLRKKIVVAAATTELANGHSADVRPSLLPGLMVFEADDTIAAELMCWRRPVILGYGLVPCLRR